MISPNIAALPLLSVIFIANKSKVSTWFGASPRKVAFAPHINLTFDGKIAFTFSIAR